MTEPKRWTPSEVYHHAVNSDRFVAAADFDRLRDAAGVLADAHREIAADDDTIYFGLGGGDPPVSDLTPEETPIPDWQFAAREEDRIAGAVAAAVAAERERTRDEIVKLLRDEAEKWDKRTASYHAYGHAADLVAREGDTTGRKKGNAGEPAKPPPGTIRHRAEGDTTDA